MHREGWCPDPVLPEAPQAVGENQPVGIMAAPHRATGLEWSHCHQLCLGSRLRGAHRLAALPAGGSCCGGAALGQPAPPAPQACRAGRAWEPCAGSVQRAPCLYPLPPVQGQARTPAWRGHVAYSRPPLSPSVAEWTLSPGPLRSLAGSSGRGPCHGTVLDYLSSLSLKRWCEKGCEACLHRLLGT